MLFNLFGSASGVKSISPSEARDTMNRDSKIVLIDVREPQEYNSGHIKGAKLVPVGQIGQRIGSFKLAKEDKIYVYCQSGGRSSRACDALVKMGYTNVYNLGGIMNWPYEIVR